MQDWRTALGLLYAHSSQRSSPPSLAPLRSLLTGFGLSPLGSALPSSGAFLFADRTPCKNAWLTCPLRHCLSDRSSSYMSSLLRRAPISSSLRTPYRNTELRILSSSLDPRLTGRAHILLPCSLPHFRFGFGPVIRPYLRIGPLFFALTARTCHHPVALPRKWTVCRCA